MKELDWLRMSGDPLYSVLYLFPFNVRDSPEHIRVAERWQIPNKLRNQQGAE
nr:plasmid SOS inhibition protein A [Klebsiella pneumoniae]